MCRFLIRHRQARERPRSCIALQKATADIPRPWCAAIYIRHRPAADRRRRLFRAGASGRSGRAWDRGDGWAIRLIDGNVSASRRRKERLLFPSSFPRCAIATSWDAPLGAGPGIHTPDRGYGFRGSLVSTRALRCAIAHRGNDEEVTSSPPSAEPWPGACGFFFTGLAFVDGRC